MDAEQFAYWLRGFAELDRAGEPPTPAQWKSIREHLARVFWPNRTVPVVGWSDPSRFAPYPALPNVVPLTGDPVPSRPEATC